MTSFSIMLLCCLNCTIAFKSQPKIFINEVLVSQDTPIKVWLYIDNQTEEYVGYGPQYNVQLYDGKEWKTIAGQRDNPKLDFIVITPFHISKLLIRIPRCKSGLYRIIKNLEYGNKTHFFSYKFFIF